jgi:hypothetical protein
MAKVSIDKMLEYYFQHWLFQLWVVNWLKASRKTANASVSDAFISTCNDSTKIILDFESNLT